MLKFKNAFTRSKSSTREAHQPDQSAADKFHQNVQRKQSSDNNDRHQQQQQQQQQQQVHVEPQQQQQQQRPRRTLAERASFASLRERRAAKQSRKRAPSKPRRSASFEGDRRSPAVPASITSSTTSSSTSSFTPPPSPHQGSDQTAPTVKRNPHHHQARVSKRTLTVGPYRLSKTLGQGSMGKVKLATHAITGEKRACKIIPRPASAAPLNRTITIGPTKSINLLPLPSSPSTRSGSSKDEDDSKEARIVREVAIMLLLHHPHIALMHEVILQDDNYYLFLEHVDGGQMLDYMINHGKLKEKHARKFLRQIVSAIDYCHQNSIVHRDLKIENVLIDKEGSIKLIDFGLSNMYAPSHQLSTFCGSLYFAAPELLSAKAYTGPEVDIWSLGVILYVLVCGKVPFDDVSMPVLHSKIKAGVVEYPSHLSEACKHLISRLLVTQPNRRATMAELKNHVWLTEGYDGPPDNYMPPREPLTLPLDMEVIERIRGFEFGTEASVATALETHISNCNDRRPGSATDCPLEPKASVYHLVREKMLRERTQEAAIVPEDPPHPPQINGQVAEVLRLSEDPLQSTSSSSSSLSSSSNKQNGAVKTRLRGFSDAADFFKKSKTAEQQPQQQQPASLSPPELPSGPRRPHWTHDATDGAASTNSLGRVLRRLSSTFSRPIMPDIPPRPAAPRVSESYHVPEATPLPEQSRPHNGRMVAPTSAPSLRSRASTTSMYSSTSTVISTTTNDSNTTPRRRGRADMHIQTLPLKHILSTTTTSYSPTQIRHILVRTLESFSQHSFHWVEIDAGFKCEFLLDDESSNPDVSNSSVVTSSPRPSAQFDYFVPDDGANDDLFTRPVQLPKQPPTQKGGRWARKLRKRSSSLWSLGSTSSGASTASTATTTTTTTTQHSLRFDIAIVKVPLVGGVHGVRFSRISGDPWRYKSLCATIIDRANL